MPQTIELPRIELVEPNALELRLEQEHLLSLEWQNRSLDLQKEVELLKLENEENVRFLQQQFVQKHSEELRSQESKLREVQIELIRQKEEKEQELRLLQTKTKEDNATAKKMKE